MSQSALAELSKTAFANQIEQLVQASQNPSLAKTTLFKLKYNSLGYASNTSLRDSLGVAQEEVDATLLFLEKYGLVTLEEKDSVLQSMHPGWKWDVWRVEGVKGYLESEVPYGPHILMEKKRLSDEQLLKAMNSVADIVEFSYDKRIALPLHKLREIRDKSHEALKSLRKQEEEEIYSKLNINRNWIGLPRFIDEHDDTKHNGYDNSHFTFYGKFSSPLEALAEGFDSASADPPIDNEKKVMRVHMINISRCTEEANKLILYNSRYGAAAERSMAYQKKLEELLPVIQGKLESSLASV